MLISVIFTRHALSLYLIDFSYESDAQFLFGFWKPWFLTHLGISWLIFWASRSHTIIHFGYQLNMGNSSNFLAFLPLKLSLYTTYGPKASSSNTISQYICDFKVLPYVLCYSVLYALTKLFSTWFSVLNFIQQKETFKGHNRDLQR